MSKIRIHTEIDTNSFLAGLAHWQISELEKFAHDLNDFILRKKAKDKEKKEAGLLLKIHESDLTKEKKEEYQNLMQKLEMETISEEERQVFLKLTEDEENLRNQRVALMFELAQLRNVTLPEVMKDLGLKLLTHA